MSSPHHLQCFLMGLRVLASVVMSKSSGSRCWCRPLGWEWCLSLLGRRVPAVQVPFCRAWCLAASCPTLSRGWSSADVRGRLGKEPSLLPRGSSAALSWPRMVPVLMPILGGSLENSPVSCRAPDGVCCLQPWDTCCLALLPGILHAGRNSRALARSRDNQSPPGQGAWGREERKPAAVFFQNILLTSNSLQHDSSASALFPSSE